MTEMTHYDMEDIPDNDVDTQIELYQQAQQVIADADPQAMFAQVEHKLEKLFVDAENSGNQQAMQLINESYEHVQRMAAFMGQQGAVLRGADGAIDTLKKQRDEIMTELQDLLEALEAGDGQHDKLIEFAEMIAENEQDYYYSYGAELWDQDLQERVAAVITPWLDGTDEKPWWVAHKLMHLLETEDAATPEQVAIFQQLFATFRKPSS